VCAPLQLPGEQQPLPAAHEQQQLLQQRSIPSSVDSTALSALSALSSLSGLASLSSLSALSALSVLSALSSLSAVAVAAAEPQQALPHDAAAGAEAAVEVSLCSNAPAASAALCLHGSLLTDHEWRLRST
jgi:hypothetical protein